MEKARSDGVPRSQQGSISAGEITVDQYRLIVFGQRLLK